MPDLAASILRFPAQLRDPDFPCAQSAPKLYFRNLTKLHGVFRFIPLCLHMPKIHLSQLICNLQNPRLRLLAG